jgi:hypothetical protein
MADQSDVETALANAIAGALYPNGSAGGSVIGTTCRIYRGWPNAVALDADLAAGIVNVTVFPDAARQRNTTRWPEEWVAGVAVAPTLSMLISGTTASVFGTGGAGMLAGLQVDTLSVVYRTQAGDTPELVAASLADKLRGLGRVALASGADVSVPGAGYMIGRVEADQPGQRESKRQSQGFRVSLWCPGPASRDSAGAAVDGALAAMAFLALPDGTGGNLRYLSSVLYDQSLNARLYRRDLLYNVDYATTITEALPSMIFGVTDIVADGFDVRDGLLS